MRELTKILLLDSTGRGHAIAEAFRRTAPMCEVHYGPGNLFAERDRLVIAHSVSLTDPATAIDYCRKNGIGMALVTNLDAIRSGAVDALRGSGVSVLGASFASSRLEADKAYCRSFCLRHQIPGPRFSMFSDPKAAQEHVRSVGHTVVVKANGLCDNGDGAHVCSDPDAAARAVEEIMIEKIHGSAGDTVLIEERLFGTEISMFALFDGAGGFLMFPPALDYKRFGDGDTGGNCDGMGSIYPHPYDSSALRSEIEQHIFRPIAQGFRDDGIDFTGFLFVGGMLTNTGIKVLEINVRFGDSEAQVIFPNLQDSLLDIVELGLRGKLDGRRARFGSASRCCVVLAQGATRGHPGWPVGSFSTGNLIKGIEEASLSGADVFFGRVDSLDGTPVTSGGRVLHVVGSGHFISDAIEAAYKAVAHVQFDGLVNRSDIGSKFAWEPRAAMVRGLVRT